MFVPVLLSNAKEPPPPTLVRPPSSRAPPLGLFFFFRERVPDVPAVYFVQPTEENLKLISRDCAANLYDAFYLNFSSSIPRALLEDLAKSNLASNTVNKIGQVHDQYTEFIALDSDLFSLAQAGSYHTLNQTGDEQKLMGV